jgi:hypothetical protein
MVQLEDPRPDTCLFERTNAVRRVEIDNAPWQCAKAIVPETQSRGADSDPKPSVSDFLLEGGRPTQLERGSGGKTVTRVGSTHHLMFSSGPVMRLPLRMPRVPRRSKIQV